MIKEHFIVYTSTNITTEVEYKKLPGLSWALVSQGIEFKYTRQDKIDVFIVDCQEQKLLNLLNNI